MTSVASNPLYTHDPLAGAIEAAEANLLARRHPDGHWVFELEADATIPAEYVMLEHYLDEIDDTLQQRIGVYLRRIQNADGGWPLFHAGDSDVSATVKAYYALKLMGDSIDAPHMARAESASCVSAARPNATSSRASRSRSSVKCRGAPCR